MKQKGIMILLVSASMLALGSCKTNKEAFNAAYERAKARQEVAEQTQPVEEQVAEPAAEPVTEPVEVVEVVETTEDVKEASETITIVDDKKADGQYGVVVGSFINRTNADSLLKTMQENGYPDAVLGRNDKDMYRVIVSFHSVKADAQAVVSKLRSQFPDAWILVKK